MHYCYGLSVINSHLLRGAALSSPSLSVADACFWELFRKARGTSFAGVPYTFDLLDRVGFADMRLPHLRYVTQAGGRLAPEPGGPLRGAWAAAHGWDLFVMYGQTEATARMAYLPPRLAPNHAATDRVPVPGGSFRLRPVPDSPDPEARRAGLQRPQRHARVRRVPGGPWPRPGRSRNCTPATSPGAPATASTRSSADAAGS